MLRQAALGAYEIVHLVPAPDGSPENPRYRIKSIAEKHERVASESELTLSQRIRVRVLLTSASLRESRSHHGAEFSECQPQLRCDAARRPLLGL